MIPEPVEVDRLARVTGAHRLEVEIVEAELLRREISLEHKQRCAMKYAAVPALMASGSP